MALAAQVWQPTSIHVVVAEWLRSERHKFAGALSPSQWKLIDEPDLTSGFANHQRLKLLFSIRCILLTEIPPDTCWYHVSLLTDESIGELHVISRCGWDNPNDSNELQLVAARRPQILRIGPAGWSAPILWGHGKYGPFTILEGNNRLTAFCSEARSGLSVPVLIGISPTPCSYHVFDPPDVIAVDLWRRTRPSHNQN
jgi:hypothetical protein